MATQAQCDKCGELNPTDASFCLICGAYLGWDQPGGAPPEETRGRTPAQAVPAEPAAPPSAGSTRPTQPLTPVDTEAMVAAPRQPSATRSAPLSPCPSCGHRNEPSRRFCGRCGTPLGAAPTTVPQQRSMPASAGSSFWGWWRRTAQERAARGAYRRSLPLLYRWRRVVLTLVTLVVLGAVVTVLAGNPVEWGKQRWYDVTGKTEPIEKVTARAVPPGSAVPHFDAKGVVDGSRFTAWATSWSPRRDEQAHACGGDQRSAVLLTWSHPVRVRALEIRAGLRKSTARTQQARPRRIDVIGGGQCSHPELVDTPRWQPVSFDSQQDVSSILVTVERVFPPQTKPHIPLVAITDIRVLARPR